MRDQEKAEIEDIESLKAEVRNLARSEIGHLFDTSQAGPDATVLELGRAIEERAVVYFCLPALQFPKFAKTLGKLVINDLKAAASERLVKPEGKRLAALCRLRRVQRLRWRPGAEPDQHGPGRRRACARCSQPKASPISAAP